MAFNNYLEDENDKPYFTQNSLAYYYDKMEGFAKAVEGSAKALNLTKEEVEKRITLYIEQNKNELDQRLAAWDGKLETFDSSVETLLTEWVDDGTLTHVIDSTLIDQKIVPVAAQLEENERVINQKFLKPYFVEYFSSFNKYGLGTPSGIAKYTGGNYSLTVSGSAGNTFVTVISGNIADAGTTSKWACVIRNDDGLFNVNKVMGTDGVNKINLYAPLKRSISNGLLGNLHDAPLGQHYTELGYFAFVQHLYFSNPRFSERNNVMAQFLEDDTTGKWTINGVANYNIASSMLTGDQTYRSVGGKILRVYTVDNTKFVEWQENIDGYKGYVEAFVGSDVGSFKAEFFLDGVLVDSQTHTREVSRVIFPFEYAKTGKIKIIPLGAFPQYLHIGRVTWFANEKYSKQRLIPSGSKVAYIGDSWGGYHNKATTRELLRLMTAEGGTPTVMNFSKSGYTSTYAKAWFDEYIIKNKPDIVIIEYFTNDFNSINGANVGTFLAPDGTQQDMNISSLTQYVANIRYMIDKAIEAGIQPIVLMPASTNSESQVLQAANNANDIWNGTKITNDTPFFQIATLGKTVTNSIEANGSTDLVIKGKAINSAERKGVIVDSDVNLTGGYIQKWANNGVDKAGVRHDGLMEMSGVKIIPQTGSRVNDANNANALYFLNSALTGNSDELRVVIKLADGTYTQKKVMLADI